MGSFILVHILHELVLLAFREIEGDKRRGAKREQLLLFGYVVIPVFGDSYRDSNRKYNSLRRNFKIDVTLTKSLFAGIVQTNAIAPTFVSSNGGGSKAPLLELPPLLSYWSHFCLN